jgi:hypothetical protein
MDFEILVDDSLIALATEELSGPVHNKHVLSLANDFEEGAWRSKKFRNFIWDNIAETALSLRERECLATKPASLLAAAARNLRLTDKSDDIGQGSELAEIVLYGIMRGHYKALSVVPKIFYKQNSQDNAKGSDSVHIVVSGGDFSLWMGEAKFYNHIADSRWQSVVESVGNSLKPDKLKKETSILTNLSDLAYLGLDAKLESDIREALGQNKSLDEIKPRIHVPILILHQCERTAKATEITTEYKEDLVLFHRDRATSYFKKQVSALASLFKYQVISFHLILFPVPSKSDITESFLADVAHMKTAGS